jgi:hypothetical protein
MYCMFLRVKVYIEVGCMRRGGAGVCWLPCMNSDLGCFSFSLSENRLVKCINRFATGVYGFLELGHGRFLGEN